jgi:hypothetical protein
MQHSPEFSSNAMHPSASSLHRPSRAATMVYQGVTIAAMLWLLGSMWVF